MPPPAFLNLLLLSVQLRRTAAFNPFCLPLSTVDPNARPSFDPPPILLFFRSTPTHRRLQSLCVPLPAIDPNAIDRPRPLSGRVRPVVAVVGSSSPTFHQLHAAHHTRANQADPTRAILSFNSTRKPSRFEYRYWNKTWNYISFLEGVRELTLEFLGFTTGLIGDNSPLLGWIRWTWTRSRSIAKFQAPMPRCSVYCSYVDGLCCELEYYVVEGLRVQKPLVLPVDALGFELRRGTVSFRIPRLICVSFGITRIICASFGITRLICVSFGITRLICASFGITRLICASDGITRLIDVRVWQGADRRGARRMSEGHMDASSFFMLPLTCRGFVPNRRNGKGRLRRGEGERWSFDICDNYEQWRLKIRVAERWSMKGDEYHATNREDQWNFNVRNMERKSET
ncbi:hypothetical protein E5676_scaffold302G001790 [Cucumis melo var. makuwa]|uniref:Ty3-gypsy retrotransposon protein n=1 Tax=Cucumis melo var. makuwa TaxID=1194695 RepID=A0A5A7UHA5_CUCMM|nr:hypothetical protein E6C27_scaffold24G00870 [Cucumis melo var. makuwa]TYK12396.1 hypothetical protein E5676_scaffold302G001790 [Cucumis melo var. makuwa]